MSAPPPTTSSPPLSLEELKASLPTRPAALILGPAIASALSGTSVVLKDLLKSGLRLAFENIGINEKLKQQVLPNLDNVELLQSMRVGSLLEAFSKSKKGLLAEWLRKAIGPPAVANPAVAAPLLNAAQSGFALASVTYDGLLETASGLKSMTWLEFHGLSQLLTPPTLLRLYGSWDQPESIVRALPGASGAELHRRAIDTYLNDLQLVVTLGAAVPFGEDPLVEGLKRRGDSLPGVVVCREQEVEIAQAFLAEHLPWFRIAPYSGGDEALPEVLASLFGTAPLPGTPALESTPTSTLPAPREPRILVPDVGSEVLDLGFTPSGESVVTGTRRQEVTGWSARSGNPMDARSAPKASTLKAPAPMWAIAIAPISGVIATGTEGGDVLVLRPNLEEIGPLENPFRAMHREVTSFGGVWGLAFRRDETLLALAQDHGHIRLWSYDSNRAEAPVFATPFREVAVTHAHAQGALAVTFSPDGQTLASAGHDRAIRFWSVPDLKPLGVLEGHDDWVGSVAYSPDGKTLASTGGDKTVILWDLAAGKPRWRADGHTEWVQSLSFHPSGELIATGSWDKTVRLWDARDGRPLKTFEGHTERIWTVAFSPDGTWLASGGDDRTIRLWPIDVAELREGAPSLPVPLPAEFRALAESAERLAVFLARVTLRHREGLTLLETLEPGMLTDALRPTSILAAPTPGEFAARALELEASLDSTFQPPPLWLAWMQNVRRVELGRLGQELLALAERATPPPAAAPETARSEPIAPVVNEAEATPLAKHRSTSKGSGRKPRSPRKPPAA